MSGCGRCQQKLKESQPDACWWCAEDLCNGCWESIGHCGHPEADIINERGRNHKPGDPLYPMHYLTPEEQERADAIKRGGLS